ncbi:hypothetical protein H257_04094 [Aphanomyces astaci]|uniref:HMG box domain-containing protein n=1 Tax=Aphanomyces astaci TaxID=112090 RepID=W4GWP7_APHAT|nr:hypothetical protein H257_04094 [Aphanomyces astaci]ETV83343.1 hypothetical protein H257_04094 [Aphanomyces astaci]|eukprot:XP_009826773.1 hypothetical protein H257_04094 [Aphanomyces astaci]
MVTAIETTFKQQESPEASGESMHMLQARSKYAKKAKQKTGYDLFMLEMKDVSQALKQTEPDANFVKQNYSGKWKELPASEKQGYKDRASTMFPQNTVERVTDANLGIKRRSY